MASPIDAPRATEATASRGRAASWRPLAFGLGALLVVLLGALVADRAFFANAITVSWRAVDSTGVDFEVDRTIEHRIAFPNQHRALSRYIQGWRFDRLPPPMTPPIEAHVLAHLDVPSGLPRFVGARGSGHQTIRVDGHPVPATGIAPGSHWLEVTWSDRRPSDRTSFELLWGFDADVLEPIPRDALTSASGAWPKTRVWFWSGAFTLGLVVAAWLARLSTLDGLARRRWLEAGATVGILALALAFRFFDYQVMPQYLENGDELFALWNGWSILHDGTPRGWTLWPGSYGGQPITMTLISMHGVEWHVIEPYFEHPPLLHVLVGAAAMLGGADDWSHTRLMHGRIVPILLSTLTTWLVIAITRRVDKHRTLPTAAPWLAGLVYAVLPILAIQGRVIKEEAILTPLVASAVLFFLRWRDDGRATRDAVLAALLAGSCLLAKVTGFAVVLALAVLFVHERSWKDALRGTALGVAVASLFPLFGLLINWQVFAETQRLQGGRPTHFNLFLRFFDDGMINMELVGRGWLLFLWLATAMTALARPRRDTVALYVVPLFYLTAIGLGSGNWTYGWYIAPVMPFLCVGVGTFLRDLLDEADFFRGALFSLTFVMYGFNFLLDPHYAKQPGSWPTIRLLVTLLLTALLTPYALATALPRTKPLARGMVGVWIAVVVGLSGYFVTHFDTIYETYGDFDRDAYFDR